MRMMANHVVGKPPPSHFRAVLSLTGKVPLTGFDWPVERRVNDVVDYVNGSSVTSLYSMVTRLLMYRMELRGSRAGSRLGVLEDGMQLRRSSGRCLDSDVTCSVD